MLSKRVNNFYCESFEVESWSKWTGGRMFWLILVGTFGQFASCRQIELDWLHSFTCENKVMPCRQEKFVRRREPNSHSRNSFIMEWSRLYIQQISNGFLDLLYLFYWFLLIKITNFMFCDFVVLVRRDTYTSITCFLFWRDLLSEWYIFLIWRNTLRHSANAKCFQ